MDGGMTMNPATAVSVLMATICFGLMQASGSLMPIAGRCVGGLVAAIGSLKSACFFLTLSCGLDQLLFANQLAGNRMAPNTALGIAILGFAFVFMDARIGRRIYIAELLAAAVCLLGLPSLIGYAFDVQHLYRIGNYNPMAINTALALECIGLGILMNRPDRGLMAQLTSSNTGGAAARRLLPIALILPPLLGWLGLQGYRAGLYSIDFGLGIVVTTIIMLFVVVVCWSAVALNRIDIDRIQAQEQLRASHEELEQRVLKRTSELKERDDQLRQAQKMEALGTLAGGVAHEFNNLIQAIQGYTRFGMDGLSTDDARCKDLQQVLTAAERASGLTRQLLGFGRRQGVELADCDPNRLTADLVKMLNPLIGADITIDLDLADNVGVIHADSGHFQQMIMNLCVNARDAMAAGGMLLIKTEDLRLSQRYCGGQTEIPPGRYLAITVSDTGTGMPPEVLEHIFEPFFTTKEVGKGTGLGLAMVYGVVQQHQGVIHVHSEVGMGTTFKIYLPVADTRNSGEGREVLRVAQGGFETILIAEDEPMVRTIYHRILGGAGYRLLTACDGHEAWEIFLSNRGEIDLLLLDVVMPRRNGRELYQDIQLLEPEIPVIFCSGYDPEGSHLRFTGEKGYQFLQKPFEPNLLLETVRQALDSRDVSSATEDSTALKV
jgi:signal transduction histidine kinase